MWGVDDLLALRFTAFLPSSTQIHSICSVHSFGGRWPVSKKIHSIPTTFYPNSQYLQHGGEVDYLLALRFTVFPPSSTQIHSVCSVCSIHSIHSIGGRWPVSTKIHSVPTTIYPNSQHSEHGGLDYLFALIFAAFTVFTAWGRWPVCSNIHSIPTTFYPNSQHS